MRCGGTRAALPPGKSGNTSFYPNIVIFSVKADGFFGVFLAIGA
jgi:hypothetical protein